MSNLINPLTAWNHTVNFIRNPITEMICAFIIEISRSYIFALIGNQLIYPILQFLLICLPWIMLGHGAIRYEASKTKGYSGLPNFNSSNVLTPTKNLIVFSFLFAGLGIIQFLHL